MHLGNFNLKTVGVFTGRNHEVIEKVQLKTCFNFINNRVLSVYLNA